MRRISTIGLGAFIYDPVLYLFHFSGHQSCRKTPPHRQPSKYFEDSIENDQWLDLLRLFDGVEDLYLSREITDYIAPALQELVGERATEVLPNLQSLFLELHRSQLVQDVVGQFIAARQLSGHPIVVSHWNRGGRAGGR
jgi:hypothetical protein